VAVLFPLAQLGVGLRGGNFVRDVQPRQRADAVNSIGITQLFDEREFQVRPRLGRLGNDIQVFVRRELVLDDFSVHVGKPQVAIVMFQRAVRPDETHVIRVEAGERFHFVVMRRLIFF